MTSGCNNFTDFPENQLTKYRLLYHRVPFFWYHLGERRSLKKYLGNGVPPRSPRVQHCFRCTCRL